MKRNINILFLIISALFLLFGSCFAQVVVSNELINNAKQHDGKLVFYSGEVIGDIMIRGEYAWVNVNDGGNAVGIWMPKKLANDIKYTGSYGTKGDWIDLNGIFHRSCLEHGGDLDIHAQAIIKIIPGREIVYAVNKKQIDSILWVFGIIAVLYLLRLVIKKIKI